MRQQGSLAQGRGLLDSSPRTIAYLLCVSASAAPEGKDDSTLALVLRGFVPGHRQSSQEPRSGLPLLTQCPWRVAQQIHVDRARGRRGAEWRPVLPPSTLSLPQTETLWRP